MSEAVQSAERKERHRSPNYPAVGLREAVERVRKLYQGTGRAGAQPEIAATLIGFAKPHGQAMSVLAALKRYGLVADVGGKLAPTQIALDILAYPASHERHRNALREAALNPTLYRELVEMYSETGLPAVEVLKAELESDKGFNPKALDSLVSDFLATLEYAGIKVSDAVELNHGDSSQRGDEIMQPDVTVAAPSGAATTVSQAKNAPTNTWTWTLSMPRSVNAELRIAGSVTKADIGRLRKQIEFLEESFDELTEAAH